MKSFLLSFLFAFCTHVLLGIGGIKGRVLDEEGQPLPYTTIFVQETGSGSISNASGLYELRLPPGTYRISFQFLGYQTQTLRVEIGDEMTTRDVVLLKQAFLLGEAEIKGGKEDPAYPIMRKAIAKSSFHRQQLDDYTCEVYLKGGGRLVDAPWFIRKQLEKEGIDTSATFVSESVSQISYTRPDKYEEKVISIRTSGDNRESSPMGYINGSFYEKTVAGLVSPLSPKAFAYYKFKYVSTYRDRDYNINKIQVIPRSRGEDVVMGMLYIVEDLWAIHSFDFRFFIQGIQIDAKQVFAPVAESVWLPVSHKYDGKGKIFGVRFEFGYLAAVSDYDITLNPDLSNDFVVIDEKTEEVPEPSKPLAFKADELSEGEMKLMAGEELTRKDLRKLLRDYEKEERQAQEEPQLIESRKFSIDTLAYKSDSAYWEGRRPIPLSTSEIRGYTLQDSLDTEAEKSATGDTLASTKGKFSPMDIITGNRYKIGKKDYLRLHSAIPRLNFNTVDGFNQEYRVSYYRYIGPEKRLEISPNARYAFSRQELFGTLKAEYRYGNVMQSGSIRLEGGKYYSQFDRDDAIKPFINTFSSLFVQNNYMRVHDRDFLEANWKHDVTPRFSIDLWTAYDIRTETFNNASNVWFPVDDRSFRPNRPENVELETTAFGRSEALKIRGAVTFKPNAIYGKRNNRYYKANAPMELTLSYEQAIPDVLNSTIDYQWVNFEFKHRFDFNLFGALGLRAQAGTFLSTRNMDFMDFMHFKGNETIFVRGSMLQGYSLLPYYTFSTSQEYLSTHFDYELRNFLLTMIPKLRMLGLEEHIKFNYLITPDVRNYMEVGYSVTNLFRFARVDVTAGFIDGQYSDFRIQLGFSSDIFSVE